MTTKILTDKQKRVLETIENYIDMHGYSPTVREICDLVKLRSLSTVQGYLDRLERSGYITKEKGESRTIRIVK